MSQIHKRAIGRGAAGQEVAGGGRGARVTRLALPATREAVAELRWAKCRFCTVCVALILVEMGRRM